MYISIHWLRGLSAIFVLYYHVLHKMNSIYGWDFYKFGAIGVDIFFIISGFVISSSFYKNRTSAVKFLENRFFRVIPIYWFLTTCALIVYLIRPDLVNRSSNVGTSVLSSYTLIPDGGVMLLSVAWTLTYEMYFYTIFALSIFVSGVFLKRNQERIISVLLISLIFVCANLFDVGNTFSNPIVFEFIFGVVVFEILGKNKYFINKVVSAFLLVLALLTYVAFNFYFEINNRLWYFGIPALLLFVSFLSLESLLERGESLIAKILNIIGDASYSIYLSHLFIIAAVMLFMDKFVSSSAVAFSICMIFCIYGGCVCHYLIEVPLTKKIKYFYSKNKKYILK